MGNEDQGLAIQNASAQTGAAERDPLDVMPGAVLVEDTTADVPVAQAPEKIVQSNIRDEAANVVVATAAATETVVAHSGFGFQSDELSTRALRDETPDTGLGQYDDPIGPIDPTLRGYTGIVLPPLYAPVNLYDAGEIAPAPQPSTIVHNLVGGPEDDFFMGLIHGIHLGDFFVLMDHDGLVYEPDYFLNNPVYLPVMISGATVIEAGAMVWDGIYNVDAGAGNDTIFMFTSNAVIDGGTGYNIISVMGNSNAILAHGGGNSIYIAGDNNNIDSAGDYTEVRLRGNNNSIVTGSSDDYFEITGNGNTLSGMGGNDVVTVNGNNNIINAGDSGQATYHLSGNGNLIYGDDSRDIFDFASADTGTSYFYDFAFDGMDADVLDLRNILDSYDALDDALADMYLTNGAEGTELYVRGAGDATFSHLATFIGGTGGYDLQDLLHQGVLMVDTPPM